MLVSISRPYVMNVKINVGYDYQLIKDDCVQKKHYGHKVRCKFHFIKVLKIKF